MVYYVSQDELYAWDGKNAPTRLPCEVWDRYLDYLKDSARRNDWKNNGAGAQFQGREAIDLQGRIASAQKTVHSVGVTEGRLTYAVSVDGVSGIYRKNSADESDSTVISDREYSYESFCTDATGRIAVSVGFAGEAHIGIMEAGARRCRVLTEGQSRERRPRFSEKDPDRILCESVGLAVYEPRLSRRQERIKQEWAMMGVNLPSQAEYLEGPGAILSVHAKTGEVQELLADESMRYSYLQPTQTADGTLYFLRAEYQTQIPRSRTLFSSLFRKEKGPQVVIGPGNVPCTVQTEKQGTVTLTPRAQLCCRGTDGAVRGLCNGILTYAVAKDGIYASDGKHLLLLDWRLPQPQICLNAPQTTFIYVKE